MRIRRSIKIKALEERSKRHRIFTKRRNSPLKKTDKFCKMADAKDGNVVEEYIDRYQLQSTSAEIAVDGGAIDMEEAADLPLTEAERRLMEAVALDEPEWDAVMKDLGLRELH